MSCVTPLLSTRYAHFNDIPPRMMWNVVSVKWEASPSGYCGETSIQSAGLLHGGVIRHPVSARSGPSTGATSYAC